MNSTIILGSLLAEIGTAPRPREGLQLIDFLGVLVYLLVTAGIVAWSSWRQKDTEDFFLGGRRMPWMAVGLSLLATLMSSISYMGVPGEMIKNGVAMFAQYMALPFSMTVVLFVWMPFFMRLRFTSAYEFLEVRFDPTVRTVGSLLFLFLRLGWMSMVMYVGSLALTQMVASLVPAEMHDPVASLFGSADSPLLRDTFIYWIILAVGVSATIYSTIGGIKAAIWNDVLQSIMLFGGAAVTLLYVMWTTGTGPSDWWRIASENSSNHTKPIFFSMDPTIRMTMVTAAVLNFSWTICTHGSDQVVLQRYFSTTSLKSARKSYLVNALTDLTIGVLLALSGLALLAFYLQNPTYLPKGIFETVGGETVVKQGDKVLPYFFAHQLPAGIGGVILAVLLCDAMQTLVSGVNSISAVFTEDLFARISKDKNNSFTDLGLAKILTVIVGLFVTCTGAGVAYIAQSSGKNIIDMMAPVFNMFLGPLASLFLIGLFLKCDGRVALVAVICSSIVSFIWSYWQFLFETDYQLTITLATVVPYCTGFLVAWLLGLVIKPRPGFTGLDYTWSSVMKLPLRTQD